MKALKLALVAALLAQPAGGVAQEGMENIIVTGSRADIDDYNEAAPLIGLRRTADFAVQPVRITGDTRDVQKRRDEIFAMVRNAIERAGREGLELSTGEVLLTPVTLANYRDLDLEGDGRPDTERVAFYVTAPLKGTDAKAALDRIERYIKAVPAVGRAELLKRGDLTLSIVNPDQYRPQIIGLIAADAKASAGALGADYGVSLSGLDRRVQWSRDGLTEVFLYIPYSYAVLRE